MSQCNANVLVLPLNAAGFFYWLNSTCFILPCASIVFPYVLNSLEVYFFTFLPRTCPLLELLLYFLCPKWAQRTSHFCIEILDAVTVTNEMFAWAVQCVLVSVCLYRCMVVCWLSECGFPETSLAHFLEACMCGTSEKLSGMRDETPIQSCVLVIVASFFFLWNAVCQF